jgi:uncharacterized protein YraI
MSKVRGLLVAIVAVCLLSVVSRPALAAERQVWAYYFGWYTGDSWGDGRLIDHPANPYDSRDGNAVAGQIDQAKGAGIDAFIMSWYGPKDNNLTNQVFGMLLDQAAGKGFHAAASLDLADPNYNSTPDEVMDSLRTIVNDKANHPGYLRFNGKPVIYFWNQSRYSAQDWRNIRNQVDPNHNTIWVAEGTRTSLIPIFDGLYLFNTAWAGNPEATARQYAQNVKSAGGSFYSPTVLPGWDESRIAGRGNPTSPKDRQGGKFLERSWKGAAASGADAILIVSWNEYLENSYIEPSQNFGTQSLDVLRPLIAAWKGNAPPPAEAAPQANPPQPGDRVVTPSISSLKVRSGAGQNFPSIGSIHQGESYAVRGESNGWYQIDFNGQTGFVFGQYVTVSGGQPTGGQPAPAGQPTGVKFTAQYAARLRGAPNGGAPTLATVPFKAEMDVVGRTGDSSWVQVNYNGSTGWMAARLGTFTGDLNAVPVTG